MIEHCRPYQHALHVQAKGGIGQDCCREAIVEGEANEQAEALLRLVEPPRTPAYSTDGKQCCPTQSRQQQRFRHWLGLIEQEVNYYARHQKQAQTSRAFKAREQAEG